MFGVDRRVLLLSFARASGAFANSFLIILLPIYIGSTAVSLAALTEITVFSVPLEEEFYIGLVLSVLGVISGTTQPIFGYLSDKYNRRREFILFGIAILGVSTFLYIIVSNYYLVFILRAIQGIGVGLIVPISVTLINEYSYLTESGPGENLGYYNTFRLIGFGSGPVVAGSIYQFGPYDTVIGSVSGIDAALLVSVIFSAISFISVYIYIFDPEEYSESNTTNEQSITETLLIVLSPRSSLTDNAINPVFVLVSATFILASCLALFATLESAINTRLNQNSLMFSLQFSLGIFGNVLFQIPSGRLGDRIGQKPIILTGFAILVPVMFAHGLVTTSIGMIFVRVALGASVAMFFPSSLALAGKIAPMNSGSILSALTSAFSFGIATGPLIAGVLYNIGSYTTPFFATGITAFVAFILLLVGLYTETAIDAVTNLRSS
jgi:MFS family permease